MSYKKFILILALIVPVVSCTEYYSHEAINGSSDGPEETLARGISGCYGRLYGRQLWVGTMYEELQMGTGLIIWGSQINSSEVGYWMKLSDSSRNLSSSLGSRWQNIWSGIYDCSSLLDKIPSLKVEDSLKREAEAEIRFLRAFFTYTAVRLWGDVPLIDTMEGVGFSSPRATFERVYRFILSDLEFAEVNMRNPEMAEMSSQGTNRPNKWAATALKSSVYLTIGSLLSAPSDNFWDTSKRIPDFSPCGIISAQDAYLLAFNSAEKVISEGPYSLCPDYRELFRWSDPGDWYSKEAIFKLYAPGTGDEVHYWSSFGAHYASYMLPPYPAGTADNGVENKNAGRVRPSRFALENFIRYSGGSKGTTGNHDKKVYNSTEDPRYAATFFDTYINQKTGETVYTYPHDEEIQSVSDAYIRKYMDPTYDVKTGKAGFYLIRLAEMYLISAEAAASLSVIPGDTYWEKAIGRVNALRSRARRSVDFGETAAPPDWTTSSFSNKEEMINAIMWERLIELMGEGHEWFDTHRHGATWLRDNIAVPANDFYLQNEDMEEYVKYHFLLYLNNDSIYPSSVSALRNSLLLAYPEDEILSLPDNYQNDFYWM